MNNDSSKDFLSITRGNYYRQTKGSYSDLLLPRNRIELILLQSAKAYSFNRNYIKIIWSRVCRNSTGKRLRWKEELNMRFARSWSLEGNTISRWSHKLLLTLCMTCWLVKREWRKINHSQDSSIKGDNFIIFHRLSDFEIIRFSKKPESTLKLIYTCRTWMRISFPTEIMWQTSIRETGIVIFHNQNSIARMS